jgi:hypothetical protein
MSDIARHVFQIVTTSLVALAIVFAPSMARAQGTPTSDNATPTAPSAAPDEAEAAGNSAASSAAKPQAGGQLFDREHRERIYDARKLSYTKATALSVAFPGLGNFYVDQYLLGALAIVSMVFAGFFIGYGVANDQSDLLTTGIVVAGGTYLWSAGTAIFGVQAYNEELRQNLHLDAPADQLGLRLTVSW